MPRVRRLSKSGLSRLEPRRLEFGMSPSESGTIAILAEKPSVARDIARVLGAAKKGEGYLQGNGYVVTWALGHLVSLAQPHEINPQWKQWRFDLLPIIPDKWPLVIYPKSKDQFEVVRKILTSPRVSRIVCATDAGREGELIFRYIYEAAGSDKPVSRLWISSLTPDAIRKGFDNLRPGMEYDRLADAACGRSRADWLVGMNLSRAYSLLYNEELSVGRVQTPTLAMVVERELALKNFVPEEYIEVIATLQVAGGSKEESYQGTWFRPQSDGGKDKEAQANATRLPADGEEAKEIIARARKGEARIESLTSETKRMQPPLLYDLTELQRHANRLFSFSAQKTLDLAQALYERHKLISYPRTDSRYLSTDVAATLPKIVPVISGRYKQQLAPGTGERHVSKRFVDDSKVSDHHAIIPTAVSPESVRLSEEERKIYDLVCRRMLMMWHEDHLQDVTTVITSITNSDIVDRYRTTGTVVQQVGWKILDLAAEGRKKTSKSGDDEKAPEQILPVTLAQDQLQSLTDIAAKKKKTRPPKRFTEGTLLTAMETAGKSLEEKELSEAMKETGLGTPATRASIIEVLLKRGYIVRTGKTLEATDKGIHLVDVVHSEVKSPVMTGQWEAFLRRIQQGDSQLDLFLKNINDYVRSVVSRVRQTPRNQASSRTTSAANNGSSSKRAQAVSEIKLLKLLKSTFGFNSFLPNQEEICEAITSGKDALAVMPSGSGMSLCYQLSGLALGGTTLIFAPLCRAIEDEVKELKGRGLAAEHIHSGLDRETSRGISSDYLRGKLQFLFIDPERLGITGFPEMLAKRKTSLAVIRDAHCISQSNDTFQPDYLLIARDLPRFRPVATLALTVSATAEIQKDIVNRLGLSDPVQFPIG
jgi:DNA topoisomerase III